MTLKVGTCKKSKKRYAYRPHWRLVFEDESGKIKESCRTAIRVHGGRQERHTSDGNWVSLENARLENTQGCNRASDADMLRFDNVIVGLENEDPSESPGKLTVNESIEEPMTSTPIPPEKRSE